jgi:hypothetical protein
MATKVGMCFDENGFGYILGDISQTGDWTSKQDQKR